MSNILGRTAFRSSRVLRASGVNSGAGGLAEKQEAGKSVLGKGAQKNPELYVGRHIPQEEMYPQESKSILRSLRLPREAGQ